MINRYQYPFGLTLPYSLCHSWRNFTEQCIRNHNSNRAHNDIRFATSYYNCILSGRRVMRSSFEHGGGRSTVCSDRSDLGIQYILLYGSDNLLTDPATLSINN